MEKINIYERKELDNGSKIEFIYSGKINKDMDIFKTKELVHKFMEDNLYEESMIKNVLILKTILRDVEENNFTLSYVDSFTYESIKYVDGKLYTYNKNFQNHYKELLLKRKYDFSYNAKETKKVSYIDDYLDIRDMSNNLNKILEDVDAYNRIRPMELNDDDKYIIEIYKMFYRENPDFSDININLKVQNMLFILSQYGINIPAYSNFMLIGKNKMPRSISLSESLDRLFAFGKIESNDELIKLSKEAKETIKIVRDEINKANAMEELDYINKNIYMNKYVLSHKPEHLTMNEYLNTMDHNVAKSLRLANDIEKRVY